MIVYVAGYPKSGTTWLTRLLGDALNCPTGASIPRDDAKEPATEGQNRVSDFIVRKGHFVIRDNEADEPVIERHVMCWRGLREKDHKVIFITRDPRDIIVSGAHYWGKSADKFFTDMSLGINSMRHVGAWNAYMNSWFVRRHLFRFLTVSYEDLLIGANRLAHIISYIDDSVSDAQIVSAYERQRFYNRREDIQKHGDEYPLGRMLNLKLLRKGISGDWQTQLDSSVKHRANKEFADLLFSLGYTDARRVK